MFKTSPWKKVEAKKLEPCPKDIAKSLESMLDVLKNIEVEDDSEIRWEFQRVYTDAVISNYDVKQFMDKYKTIMKGKQ